MGIMTHWDSREYWSIAHDCDVSRISGYDERSAESFMMIQTGAGFHERRKEAVLRIMDHIEQGNEPGEVRNGQT